MPVTAYSTTAASNNGAVPNGAPEGMAPSSVNDVIRQIMADVALEAQVNNVKVLKLVAGTNTITADMDPELSAYVTGMMVVFVPFAANTGVTTINIDGLGAKAIVKGNAAALAANDLLTTVEALLIYNGTAFDLMNPASVPLTAAGILAALVTVDGAGSGLDADLLDGISSAGFAQITSGSFVGTYTGVTGTVTVTINYLTTAKICCLYVSTGSTGTSNATTFTITTASTLLPAAAVSVACGGISDNSNSLHGSASLTNNVGTLLISLSLFDTATVANRVLANGSAFTASGNKGLVAGWCVIYPLA